MTSRINRREFFAGVGMVAAAARSVEGQSRRTRLVLLGTGGGPRPRTANSASAQVIVSNGAAYVIDCGDGVARQMAFAGVPLASLRHVFITHQHDLIGMSHGGVAALLFALSDPHRVRTLTLVEPPAFWVLPNQWPRRSGRARDAAVPELAARRDDQRGSRGAVPLPARRLCRRSPRQAPQWGQWVKYRNSLRALHTIGDDYDDDPAKLRTLSVSTLVIHGASTVPFHRSINDALLRALPNGRSFELAGGHNSPASSPDYLVEAWHSFQSQAAPPEASDASFDAVLAAVEAAQVQLVNGQPGPFKALWSHGEDVTLSGGSGGAIARGWTQVSERLDWVATQYTDGVRTHQEVARYVAQDLAYVVLRETIRFKNPADGRAMVHELRVTQVSAATWPVAHRASTRGFASGQKPSGLSARR